MSANISGSLRVSNAFSGMPRATPRMGATGGAFHIIPHEEAAMKTLGSAILASLLIVGAGSAAEHSKPVAPKYPLRQDKSPPLDQLRPKEAPSAQPFEKQEREKENFSLPLPERKRPGGPAPMSALPFPSPPSPLALQLLLKADGIRQGVNYNPQNGVFPPDANGSVGDDRYVQWVNQAVAVFDKKSGAMLPNPMGKSEPFDGNLLWSGFGGACELDNDGDPIALYDRLAHRWLMSQFAIRGGGQYKFAQCIAISDGPDPIKSRYYRYEFGFNEFNDYPKFAIWRDAYYATFNMFRGREGGFLGSRVCAFERSKLLAGDAKAKWDCVDPKDELKRPVAGLLPADLDGGMLPPNGSPAYALGFGSDELRLWRLKVDWSKSKPLQFSDRGPILLPVSRFDPACNNADCVVQKDTAQRLGTLADRLMYRLSYRNLGDHESMVLAHTVEANGTSGIRWYELRRDLPPSGAQFQVSQQQTFAPDGLYRWLGSIAMDKQGNMLLIYNTSSANSYPSLRYTGRLATDPSGAMSEEGVLVEGKRSVAADRWGDYASVSLDPVDDCTFWVTGQYLSDTNPAGDQAIVANSAPNTSTAHGTGPQSVAPSVGLKAPNVVSGYHWDTAIASLRFPTCH